MYSADLFARRTQPQPNASSFSTRGGGSSPHSRFRLSTRGIRINERIARAERTSARRSISRSAAFASPRPDRRSLMRRTCEKSLLRAGNVAIPETRCARFVSIFHRANERLYIYIYKTLVACFLQEIVETGKTSSLLPPSQIEILIRRESSGVSRIPDVIIGGINAAVHHPDAQGCTLGRAS